MAASNETILRRISLAVDAGSPPSPVDTDNWTLCRRTGRSHANLLMVAAMVNGDYSAFLSSLGYNPQANPTFNLDDSYWHHMCDWIAIYIPAFEKEAKRLTDLQLPDSNEISENVARILGIPVDFLSYFAQNKIQIKEFLDNLRPDLGAMAELKLLEQIAAGDPATIRWALPRLMPKQYHLTNSMPKDAPENVTVIFGGDDE